MDKLKSLASRTDMSNDATVHVLSLIKDISECVIARTYGHNSYLKELIDNGEYQDAKAVSEVFDEIVGKCREYIDYTDEKIEDLSGAWK